MSHTSTAVLILLTLRDLAASLFFTKSRGRPFTLFQHKDGRNFQNVTGLITLTKQRQKGSPNLTRLMPRHGRWRECAE